MLYNMRSTSEGGGLCGFLDTDENIQKIIEKRVSFDHFQL